ncbi:MAG: hypothetical protein IT289_02070 [Oligoflexia bacterium]|nr:hypothetical protein [Oligoflexia bacterium]
MRVLYLAFLVISLSSLACNRPLNHPENADLIYLDLKKRADSTLQKIKQAQAEVDKAKAAWEASQIRTGERQATADEYFRAVKSHEKLVEKHRFLISSMAERRSEVLNIYPEYYAQKKPWPDEEAFAKYEAHKRLSEAPREWIPELRIKKWSASRKAASSQPGNGQAKSGH